MEWEYKVVRFDKNPKILFHLNEKEIESKLNSLGTAGWELVSLSIQRAFLGGEQTAVAALKRKKS